VIIKFKLSSSVSPFYIILSQGGGVLSELTDLMFSSKKKKKEKKEKYMTQKCASVTKQNNLVSAKGGDLFGRESSREPGGK